ncbi:MULTISPECIES: TIGR03986 family CRISPR-associated RAMP protein [unclassified Nostoc]|uniref:TIGR03986 family type III CRISPR-associated RAMP protein n=1 Tax=unclassified Nostoc TaxID=2593658 RepID=UPI002AD2FA24|nr:MULTISPECIES: TIGR03986 family CRISPR-associated RAMP protein [unclassified Nostoc]MDZ8122127.1 TIGR03986 family CRISPR-associated RAMP protein [Nostoc sp. CmiVER01]MDZ8227612.1 TIGR03986 family CRISPR-associated RAMP protein [Nostoc sp. ChiVER01]
MKKHIRKIPNKKKAIAPYNFVELPDKIVSAELESNGKLRNNNCYYPDRHTGRIECILTTSSPLYIRCGLTKEEFESGKEAKNSPDFYYIDLITKKPILPGSSLRGMLRTLIEIISFSKITQVSDHQRLYFRAVATLPKDDSLAQAYKQYIKPNQVKAGYLKRDGDIWKIIPARENNSTSFAWVKEEDLSSADFPELKRFDDPGYLPQNIPISFKRIRPKGQYQYIVEDVTIPKQYPLNQGRLVTSGNMKETSDTDSESIRTYHCVVFAPDPRPSKTYIIDPDAIKHYCNALTDFQQKPPFDEKLGMLQEDRPVFYCQPKQGNIVTLFGHSPNFRIPCSPKGDAKAATVVDFIPEYLRDDSIIDIAEAIFGFVRQKKQPEGKNQSRAGRISVSDAICETPPDKIFMTEGVITPKILASPKPSTYQHYLVQPEETKAEKSKLKHYASQPTEETVIRGHKLYWHKGSNYDIHHPKPDKNEEIQTQIQPIKAGVTFNFTIQFENLSNVEIGALMWILDIAPDNNYRLSLGMGKPLGMGAVKIESKLYLSKRKVRYTQLFNNNSWEIAENLDDNPDYQQIFENYVLQQLQQTGKFKDIPRIQMLLTMLSWHSAPSNTRYMEIKREQNSLDGEPNEYKNRRVLPTPLDVID